MTILRALRLTAAGMALLAALSLGSMARDTGLLTIRRAGIVIHGAYPPESGLTDWLDTLSGRSVRELRGAVLQSELDRFPEVRRYAVHYRFPAAIDVDVYLRTPVAELVTDGISRFMDGDQVLFPAGKSAKIRVPRFEIVGDGPTGKTGESSGTATIILELARRPRWRGFQTLQQKNSREIRVWNPGLQSTVLFRLDSFSKQFERLSAYWNESAAATGTEYDMRFENMLIIRGGEERRCRRG